MISRVKVDLSLFLLIVLVTVCACLSADLFFSHWGVCGVWPHVINILTSVSQTRKESVEESGLLRREERVQTLRSNCQTTYTECQLHYILGHVTKCCMCVESADISFSFLQRPNTEVCDLWRNITSFRIVILHQSKRLRVKHKMGKKTQ